MTLSPADDALRLPNEPYPGLRPFLNHESSLLLGRERQVREVIVRLQQTQFVAVIGGSGSGKSSLVLAGVVPELRSFGIPQAGDFWVPMICTPGTNVSAADAASARNTPVTRLAWKFAKLLKPAESAAAEQARLDDIAAVFRQEAGFARLIDRYAEDLQLRPGPATDNVRMLFVIDQFEELFHPTNRGVDDAQLLVERVIDHFFSPHPRCYVVLTMRSEHLNDCAGYLELPDAINKSSYLVRRLDEAELREAITGPSQRYLRLLQRLEAGSAQQSLPSTIAFDPAVVDRLMRDVGEITNDPDHLPLLQHLLARLWEAACQREGVTQGVPAAITPDDLARAVGPGFDARANALRKCLENRAEAVYQQHTPEQRADLDSVLRRLSFKDPNTGMYTQQRVDVDDPTLFDGRFANPRETLHALIADGFIGSVDYLFWDDENPQRTTLKVSHESFIRGWARFRRWADEDDRQFQVYLRLLDDCARWLAADRDEASLSTGQTLRLYQDAGLDTSLRSPQEASRFARLLGMDRDGLRVASAAGEALDFLDRSLVNREARAAERERAEAQQRTDHERATQARQEALLAEEHVRRVKVTRWALAGVLAGICVVTLAELMLAHKERTLHRSFALAAETQVKFAPQFNAYDAMGAPLLSALMGTQFLEDGQELSVGPAALPPLSLLYSDRLAGLQRTGLLSRTRNAASLRTVLQGGAWLLAQPDAATAAPIAHSPGRDCQANFSEQDRSAAFPNARFYGQPTASDARGLIVTFANPAPQGAASAAAGAGDASAGADGMSVFAGRMLPARANGGERCLLESQLISTPPLGAAGASVGIGLSADLSNLVLFFPDSLQFYALLWSDPQQVQLRPRAVVDIGAQEASALPKEPVTVLESRNAPFATDIRVGARSLRLFDVEPTPIGAAEAREAGLVLERASAPGVCAAFAESLGIDPADPRQQVLTTPAGDRGQTYCLHLKTLADASLVLATLYAFGDESDARNPLDQLAPLYLDLVVGAQVPLEFRIDTRAGWLAFTHDGNDWRAVPWSMQALRGLAKTVFAPQPAGLQHWARSGMLQLIVGTEDRSDRQLPERLGDAPDLPRKAGK